MTNTPKELPRVIGLLGASGVMIGVMVGSGIFRAPTTIANHVNSPSLTLLAWVLGGLLSLAGALTFSELITMMPRSGGVYQFLREGYGRPLAFTFGWTYQLVTKPAAAAGIAFVCAEALNTLLGTKIDNRLLVSGILILLTTINLIGVRGSTRIGVVLTAMKVSALMAIALLGALALLGLWKIEGVDAQWPASAGPATAAGLLTAIAPVMSAVLWTYDGWSDIGSVAGEVKNPSKQLPRLLIINTLFVTGLYVAVNATYLLLVPIETMKTLPNLAPHVIGLALGASGAIAVTVLVLVSSLGSSHASVMTGARVSFAQANDGLMFRFLGHIQPRFQTPDYSLISQLVLSLVATWMLGTFDKLTSSFIFTMWIFYGLAGFSIFILRKRQPERERPFRCPGYPIIPAMFVLSAAGMTVLSIIEQPWATLPWLGVLFLGWPVYLVWNRLTKPRTQFVQSKSS